MFKNYLKIAFRNLYRNRTYSLINILGLGLGLATGFLLLIWVNNEYSMNKYHSKADRIYQLNAKLKIGNDERIWENSPAPVAVFARQNLPDFEVIARLKSNIGYKQIVKHTNQVFIEDKIGYTENELFRILDFPVVAGNPAAPLAPGLSVAMTQRTAKRYFGADDPIGKVIRFRDTTFQVSAVIEDFPSNSSFQYDMLFSIDIVKIKFRGNGEWKTIDEDWGNYDYSTFFLVKKGANLANASRMILNQLEKVNPKASVNAFLFRPLDKLYLYKPDGSKGQAVMVEIFFIIAVFVLLIACINYVNLVTARATQRIKEISIRKIVGAEKRQLFWQFFIETGVLLAVSCVVCFLFIEVLLPVYRLVSGNELSYNLSSMQVWKVLLLIIGSVWLLSGLYPALLLSSFNPFRSLKGTGFLSNAGVLRKSLVVLQFIVSITLLLGTVFINRQMRYIREKDLNIETANIVSIPLWRLKAEEQKAFRQELEKLAAVSATTAGDASLFEGANTTTGIDWPGKPEDGEMWIAKMNVEKNFMDFFNTRLKEGADFTNTSPNNGQFILNETAVSRMGLKNPIGQRIEFNGQPGTIIGVVKDFYFESFHKELMPALINYSDEDGSVLYARIQQKEAQSVIAYAQKLWKRFQPELPMEYGFLDDRIAAQYDKEARAATLFDAFTIITLFISCLGLFGLATHSAERRVKEVGIRKVMGARVGQLAALLSKEFVVLVLIALAVAIPLVWWGMQYLLDYFAYRISLEWWIFLITGIIAILVAVITVSFQAIKAASANPVKSLRTE